MPAILGYSFKVFEYQNGDQSCPYLYHNGIFVSTDKCFDMQQLLDFPEKNLDLPTCFVKLADGVCRPSELVGDDLYGVLVLFIPDAYPSELSFVLLL